MFIAYSYDFIRFYVYICRKKRNEQMLPLGIHRGTLLILTFL